MDPELAPVARLDPERFVQTVNAHAGCDLTYIGSAGHGEVGAAFVRWPDGRDGVLTRGASDAAQVQQAADVLEIARSSGIPAPRYDLIADLPDGSTAIIQERLPGSAPERVDRNLLEAMVTMSDQLTDLLANRSDVKPVDLYLTRSGPGFCLHESLQRYNDRTRALLERIREIGDRGPSEMTGRDLVHLDFHPGNVLVGQQGRITGVVDWDGIGRGDRAFCLVTLRFDVSWGARFSKRYAELRQHDVDWLDERLDGVDHDNLMAYRAHMSLRLVDWSIRHHDADVVDHYVREAWRSLDGAE